MIENWGYWLGVVLVGFSGVVAVSGGLAIVVLGYRLIRGWLNA